MLSNCHILLIISGGIAAFKSLDLIRRLREREALVTTVMTKAASEFVTPLSVASVSGKKVFQDLFDLTSEAEMGHIELSRSSDLIVVAPASADIMSKMATGLANDLASTLLLATDTPVLTAPAMNVRMWEHPATRRNFETLKQDGVAFVGPNLGGMACGEYGIGRMAEPLEIVSKIEQMLSIQDVEKPLLGKRFLVTSGPTHEPIDPVRFIANKSSGAQGTAIANALIFAGAEVVFITGPAEIKVALEARVVKVETADEMYAAVQQALPCDGAIFAAAVADWKVKIQNNSKIKKGSDALPLLRLAENRDILATVATMDRGRPKLVIGFAAETDDLLANAKSKLDGKGCDWIIANDVSPENGIFGGNENIVTLINAKGVETWDRMTKEEVARKLVKKIAEIF